jgi:VanZ family protein
LSQAVGTRELTLSPARRAAAWLPVLVWLFVVMGFSQGTFSAAWSMQGIGPLVRVLGLTPEQAAMVHFFIRKGAHVLEYAVLGLLAFRAATLSLPARPVAAAAIALGIALAMAAVDEWHQAYEPTRTGTPRDVALDLAGACGGVAVWRRWKLGLR